MNDFEIRPVADDKLKLPPQAYLVKANTLEDAQRKLAAYLNTTIANVEACYNFHSKNAPQFNPYPAQGLRITVT